MKERRSEEAWREGGIRVPEFEMSVALLVDDAPADVAAVTAEANSV